MCRSPIKRRHYVDLVVALGYRRADSRVTAVLILLHLLPLFLIEIIRVWIERVKHADDRSLGQFAEVDLACVMVVSHEEGVAEVLGNLLPRGRIIAALSEPLRRMRACKRDRDDQGDDNQPVPLFRFHREPSPRKQHRETSRRVTGGERLANKASVESSREILAERDSQNNRSSDRSSDARNKTWLCATRSRGSAAST